MSTYYNHTTPADFVMERKVAGWYSRGYLPHFNDPGNMQSLNFRLHDAVPLKVIDKWKAELEWREELDYDDPRVAKLQRSIAKYEDAGYGACWLRDERIATLVENALFYFDGKRYRLIAWCIMPNHVHVLVETWPGWLLDSLLHSWKAYTALEANKILGRSGPFWFREFFDRYIRDENHYHNTVRYIEENPVKAGLVVRAEEWRFSSAWWRARPVHRHPGNDSHRQDGGGTR